MRKMAPAAARRRGGDGAALLGRASLSTREEEEVLEREKEATKGQGMKSLLSPTIYRRAKGGGRP